jgi:hypothetical protein
MQGDSTVVPIESAGAPIPDLKSGTTAFLWSFLGTAVPAVPAALLTWDASGDSPLPGIVLVGALLIGPSLGHFYAARPGRAFAGIGIRALGGVGVALGGLAATSEGDVSSGTEAVAIIGGIVVAASLAWDIIEAPHSARVHNDQISQGRTTIGITPSMGTAGLGLRADVSF